MGFNLKFDMDFLTEWFRKLDFKYFGSYTNYRPLDAYNEACSWAFMGGFAELENLKLETLSKACNIEIEAHNALSDILATRELWYKLVGFHTVEGK
jgi:DNA polymerase III epsilon subunit-like protein